MCLNLIFICIEAREKQIREDSSTLRIGVYCMQKKRLGNTDPTQQTISWSEFVGPRYPPKKCTNRMVRFGAANFWTFLRISRPRELGSTYRLLHWNRVPKPLLCIQKKTIWRQTFLALRGRQDFLHLTIKIELENV